MARKKIVAVLVVILVIIAAFLYLNRPASGSFKTSAPKAREEAKKDQVIEGKTFSAVISSQFEKSPTRDDDKAMIDSMVFVGGMANRRQLAIGVKNHSGKLSGDSSYRVRELHPETYELTHLTVYGASLPVMSKKGEYEKVVFWPQGGKLATIALSSDSSVASSNPTELDSELQQILNKWQWK